jgi:hypothetical protein
MIDFTLKPQPAAKSAGQVSSERRHGSPPFRHILVAVDGSEHSTWAADAAGRLARELGARITLVHVAGVPMIARRRRTHDPGRRDRVRTVPADV